MRTIRASELGTFQYCRRAWWYQRQGVPSENQMELAGGSEFHREHGRRVLTGRLARLLSWLLLGLALALAVAALASGWMG
ncbi:hypothetical protein FDZ74_15740 [bacterium]|nr:MAG: hypothetical protein FDZ74_15740 [bacterium]